MTEDVIEFGATRDRSSRRLRSGHLQLSRSSVRSHPQLPKYLAAAGALAGFASLLTPWRAVTLPGDSDEWNFLREYVLSEPAMSLSGHPAGAPYLVALIALAAVVALALFGTPGVRHTARIAGLALTGASLALIGATGYMLTNVTDLQAYLGPGGSDEFISSPDTGFWAAVAALLLAGAALLLSHAPQPSPDPTDAAPQPSPDADHDRNADEPQDPGDLELTVAEAPPVRFPG